MMTNPSVLVVEDNEAYRAVLRRAVRAWAPGSEVVEAPDKLGASRTPWSAHSLVILDLNLPDGSGIDLLKEAASKGTQVLVLTGSKDESDIAACLELGVADFLTKPVDLNVLESKIRTLMERHYVSSFRFLGGKPVEKPILISQEVRLKYLSMGAIELEAPFFVPRGLEFRVNLEPGGDESALRVRAAYVRYDASTGRYSILAAIDPDTQTVQQFATLRAKIQSLKSGVQ